LKRAAHSFRTRHQGFEHHSPADFYASVLSDAEPVAWPDKIVLRAPASALPFAPDARRWAFVPLTGKHGRQSSLRPEFRPLNAVVKLGQTAEGLALYLELIYLDPFRRVISAVYDILETLFVAGVLLSGRSDPRRAAADILPLFIISEIETRYDCGPPLSDVVMDLAVESAVSGLEIPGRTSVNVTAWEHRHERGSHVKVYGKGEDFVRAEIVLYTQALGEINADIRAFLRLRPGRMVARLWQVHRDVLRRLRRAKPVVSAWLSAVVHRPIALDRRCRALGLPWGLVREMMAEGQAQNIF